MSEGPEHSPWICHICDYKSTQGESKTCDACYRVTCGQHLVRMTRYNRDSGLYEMADVCLDCAAQRAD